MNDSTYAKKFKNKKTGKVVEFESFFDEESLPERISNVKKELETLQFGVYQAMTEKIRMLESKRISPLVNRLREKLEYLNNFEEVKE